MERPFAGGLHIARVIQYLKDREQEEGGFSLIPQLYPDIEDTYYAIRTFLLLNHRVNRDQTDRYLKSMDWRQVHSPRTIYMLTYLHCTLRLEIPSPLIQLLNQDGPPLQTLDGQYFSDEIQKLLNRPLKPLLPLLPFHLQPHENVQALRKKVTLWINHGVRFARDPILLWVRSCQNGDGGFGFYPGTTSYMENTYCALEILSKLNSSPTQLDLCRKYILGCQTKSGGFGRAPASFPFIESTFHAVMGLFLLEKMGGEEV